MQLNDSSYVVIPITDDWNEGDEERFHMKHTSKGENWIKMVDLFYEWELDDNGNIVFSKPSVDHFGSIS